MHRGMVAAVVAAGTGIGLIVSASAADLPAAPVYKAAPTVSPSGWYIYEDGIYENVALPSNLLGLHNVGPGLLDAGPTNNFSTRLNGEGVRGGLGYVVPGTGWRMEATGSYVRADGTQNQTGALISNDAVGPVFLNGAPTKNAFTCGGIFNCSSTAQLSTSYVSWQAGGKIAYDMQWAGPVSLSPFVALFGGSNRSSQTLSQTFLQTGLGFVDNGTYGASTALAWNDFGGRIGLDAIAPVTNWLSWSFAGSVGLADRMALLTGSDSASSTAFVFNGASAISTSATTTAFVANLESGFAIKPMPSVTLRAFGGVNFDNRVPGVSAPSYAGPILAPTGATSAAISFSSETSYYAGAGAIWKF